MASTLIFQIDIGDGTQWGKETSVSPIRDCFIPSIQLYAQKNGYDYKLVTESEYAKQGGKFDFLATKNKHYSFERYYHFKQDYDRVVYIDNDVYAPLYAEPLPEVTGFMNVREHSEKMTAKWQATHNTDTPYYNSGVTIASREVAAHLQDYMQYREQYKLRSRGKNTDNMLLNEYILEHPQLFKEMDHKWNYMPFMPGVPKLERPNFIHFVGIDGKAGLEQLLQDGKSIEEVLCELYS